MRRRVSYIYTRMYNVSKCAIHRDLRRDGKVRRRAALRALRIVSSLGSLLCGVIRKGLLLALFLPARPLLFVQCESPYNSVPNAFLPELAMVSDKIMSGQFDEIYDFF